MSTRRGSGTRPALLDAWRRPAAMAAIFVVTLALGVPLVVLVREALGAQLWSAVVHGSGDAIANSLLLATAGATAVVSLAVWLGYPRCVAGARRRPPEDCGGVHGYMDFLTAISNPAHPEHESSRTWAGASYDPDAFDPTTVVFDDPLNRWKIAFERQRS